MTAATCDPRALSVARAVHQRERPQATILFGSRARGDHDEYRSDIDIMLLGNNVPDDESQEPVNEWVESVVRAAYGREVPVQLVWRTLDEFRHNRRYVNSLETNAVKDGVFMSQDPNQRDSSCYEDAEVECEHDWSPYDERLRHAEAHLYMFELGAANNAADLAIGQQAQNTLEHAMKALLEAHRVSYQRTHNIGHLLGHIRQIDSELREYALGISPDIYTQYAGEQVYGPRRHPPLTDQPDYRTRTVADAQRIIDRAREVRQGRTD